MDPHNKETNYFQNGYNYINDFTIIWCVSSLDIFPVSNNSKVLITNFSLEVMSGFTNKSRIFIHKFAMNWICGEPSSSNSICNTFCWILSQEFLILFYFSSLTVKFSNQMSIASTTSVSIESILSNERESKWSVRLLKFPHTIFYEILERFINLFRE